ncbi:hypothetical protein TWF102_002965 [Orbilia oligospora]|uniref:Uncharacterized protein n=1 Tax=Orbilia oligospora TaxID=2813651 RepID=A0A7C8IZA8_ORBOL|nr:hypothetical protein TWF102_002965 [Orbilia oligospora]
MYLGKVQYKIYSFNESIDEKSLTRVFHDLIKRGAISCFEYRRLDGALAIPPLGVGNATYGAILKLSSSRSARTSHLFNRPRDNKRYVLSPILNFIPGLALSKQTSIGKWGEERGTLGNPESNLIRTSWPADIICGRTDPRNLEIRRLYPMWDQMSKEWLSGITRAFNSAFICGVTRIVCGEVLKVFPAGVLIPRSIIIAMIISWLQTT